MKIAVLNEFSQAPKPLLEALKAIDPELVKGCMIPRFLDCFYAGCRDDELKAFVDEVVSTL